MKDTLTGQPLRVSTDGRSAPFVIVPFQQVDSIRRVLEKAQIHHWVDRMAVSVSGGPAMIVVNFAKNADTGSIQEALDRAS